MPKFCINLHSPYCCIQTCYNHEIHRYQRFSTCVTWPYCYHNFDVLFDFLLFCPISHGMTVHILPNISWSKSNQAMKFGQLIYYKRNIFLQKSSRRWGRQTSSSSFCFFRKTLYQNANVIKQMVHTLVLIILTDLDLAQNKNKLHKTSYTPGPESSILIP